MTNAEIILNVKREIESNMRKDIIAEFRNTRTGVCVSFQADMGENRFGRHEYAHITTYKFYRIQGISNIIMKLKDDRRLYA